MIPAAYRCDRCGAVVVIGEWPFCPHGKAAPSKGFEPRFDPGLGREVTGWGALTITSWAPVLARSTPGMPP